MRICSPTHRLSFFCIVCFLSVAGNGLHAQPVGSHRESLQWLTVEADVIVHGKVANVSTLDRREKYPEYFKITIEPQEVIKGEAAEQFCFVSRQPDGYEALLDSQRDACFFLTSSRHEFGRTSSNYFYAHCPWECWQFYGLHAEKIKAVWFDETGIRDITSGEQVLSLVKAYNKSLEGHPQLDRYAVREPDHRAFTGFDSQLTVPLNQTLYSVATKWSKVDGIHARVGKEILADFTPLIDYETAKSRFDDVPQVQTGRQYASTLSIDSLEWMATDCDLIVKGTIADAVLVKKGDPQDRNSYYNTLDRHLVKLRVSEFIKGKAGPTVSFVLNNGGKISQWQQDGVPIVVFLRDRTLPLHDAQGHALIANDRRGDLEMIPLRYVGRGEDTHALISFDTEDQRPFLSMDLTLIDDPQEMVDVVKAYLQKTPAAQQPVTWKTQSWFEQRVASLKEGTPWEGDQYAGVRFPINNSLEDCARQWVKSPDQLHRWLGVCGLAWFNSERNAEILKARLDDPGTWEPPVYTGRSKVKYLVRWEAWITLTAWGYDVPEVDFGKRK